MIVFDEIATAQAVMHYSRHHLMMYHISVYMKARTCQPMANGFTLDAYWSVHQNLNYVSSVHLRRSVCSFTCLQASSLQVISSNWHYRIRDTTLWHYTNTTHIEKKL